MKISVVITLKKDVLDPQGKVIHQTLDGMGFEGIKEVRQGKYFEIDTKEDDKLGDPLIAEEHILAFDWATKSELEKVKKMILRINDFMIGMFRGVGIKLIDFKLEFGRLKENGKNEVILADEISPDTCRLWDSITDKKLDKDRFRKDLGDLIPAYTEVARRLGILHEQSNLSAVNVTKLRSIKKRK